MKRAMRRDVRDRLVFRAIVPVPGGRQDDVAAAHRSDQLCNLHQRIGIIALDRRVVRFAIVERPLLSNVERITSHRGVVVSRLIPRQSGRSSARGDYLA